MVGRLTWRMMHAAIVAVAVGCAVGLVTGCNQQSRYRMLTFFFDGVPDPNAPKVEQAGGRPAANPGGPSGPTVILASIHKPYKEEKCDGCHTAAGADIHASALDSRTCMGCHENVPLAYPVMHGPVASKACLWCHTPHQSEHPHLLRTKGTALCLQCHDLEVLSLASEGHKPNGPDCLSCHDAHGGQKRYMLKPVPATQPAVVPAVATPATRPSPLVSNLVNGFR